MSTRALLLDLDGALVDPAPGIIGSFRHALAKLGVAPPPAEELGWIIGPPLRRSFARLLGEHGPVEDAVRLYRERYADWGVFQARIYAGVVGCLSRLRAAPFNLFLCTSKPAVFARRVVDHFGLAEHLSAVYGPDLDGRFDDKGDLIAHLLASEGLAPAEACMIGDREHDVMGAARNGVRAIGVLWGYGSEAELRASGAWTLARQPSELPELAAAAFAGPDLA
jgi:phosphoglycolate phosphatase